MKKLIKRVLTGFLAVATMLTAIPTHSVQAAQNTTIKFIHTDSGSNQTTYTGETGSIVVDITEAWTDAVDWAYETVDWYVDAGHTTKIDNSTDMSSLEFDENTKTYTIYSNEELKPLNTVLGSIRVMDGNSNPNLVSSIATSLDMTVKEYVESNISGYAYNFNKFYMEQRRTSNKIYVQDDTTTIRDLLIQANPNVVALKIDKENIIPTTEFIFSKADTGAEIIVATVSDFETQTISDLVANYAGELQDYDLSKVENKVNEDDFDASMMLTVKQWWETYSTNEAYLAEKEAPAPSDGKIATVKFIDKYNQENPYVATLDERTAVEDLDLKHIFLDMVNYEKLVPFFYKDVDCAVSISVNADIEVSGDVATVYLNGAPQNLTTVDVNFYVNDGGTHNRVFATTLNKDIALAEYVKSNAGIYIFNKDNLELIHSMTSNRTTLSGSATVLDALRAVEGIGKLDVIIDKEHVFDGKKFEFRTTDETPVYVVDITGAHTTTVQDVIDANFKSLDGYDISMLFTKSDLSAAGDTSLTVADWFVNYGVNAAYVVEAAHEDHQVTVKFVGGTQDAPEQYTFTYTRAYGDDTVEIERMWKVSTSWKKDYPTLYVNAGKSVPLTETNYGLAEVAPNEYTFYFKNASVDSQNIEFKVYAVDGDTLTLLGTETGPFNGVQISDLTDHIGQKYYYDINDVYALGRVNTNNSARCYKSNSLYTYMDARLWLTEAKSVDAKLYVDADKIHNRTTITVYDIETGDKLVELPQNNSSQAVASIISAGQQQLFRYDLENVYANAERELTDTTKTISQWFDTYGHTKAFVEKLPRTYEIKVYDVIEGVPTLAGTMTGLNGTGTLGEAITLATTEAANDYDYLGELAYSDLRCTTTINRETTVADFCGDADSKAIYFSRVANRENDKFEIAAYSVSGGNRQLISTHPELTGEITLQAAIEMTLPNGYNYNIEEIYSNFGLTNKVDLDATVADFCGTDSYGEIYLDAAGLTTTFEGTIMNINYANGEVRQAYKPAANDVVVENNTIVKINVPETISVNAIYFPYEIDGLGINPETLSYAKSAFTTLADYGVILEEGVKLTTNVSGAGITHFIVEGPIRIKNVQMDSFFTNCTKLKYVEGLEYIVDTNTSFANTFENCQVLEYVYMDATNADLTQEMVFTRTFKDCPKLKEVEINGANISTVYAMFDNGGKARATASVKSPLERIGFTNCNFAGFVSTTAFADAYAEYDLTGSTGIMRADLTDLFQGSYAEAQDKEVLNETPLTFKGWSETISDASAWFKGAKIANADFSGLEGLKNAVAATAAFENATITSAVAKSFNEAFSSSTVANIERMYSNTKVILTTGQTNLDAQKDIETTLVKKVSAADNAFDSAPARNTSIIDYSTLDLSDIVEFKPSMNNMYRYNMPAGKLPTKVALPIPYYAKVVDNVTLQAVRPASGFLLLKANYPNTEVLVNETHKIDIMDTDAGTTSSVNLLEGTVFSDAFSKQLYSDKDLTIPFDMSTVAQRAATITLYAPSAVQQEVKGDEKFANATYKFSNVSSTKATYEDGTTSLLSPNGEDVYTTMSFTDVTEESTGATMGYVKYRNAVVYNIDLLAKSDVAGQDKKIVKLNNEVTITLPLPDDYKANQGFAVYNYHEGLTGEPIKLIHSIDKVAGTVTFKTNLFSPFLIAYNDVVEDDTYSFWVRFDDTANIEGQRPASVGYTVYLNGIEYKKVNVMVNKNDEYQKLSFDVPSLIGGVKPVVTKTVTSVGGYTVDFNATYEGESLITYSYQVKGTDSIQYTLKFDDENNVSGKRPESIAVNLESTNGQTQSLTHMLSPATQAEYKSTVNVPKGSGTWKIASVGTIEGYTTTVDGLTATFKHTPEMMEKNIIVKWEGDGDNADKTRPDKITATLTGGGKTFTVEVKSADSWSAKTTVYKYLNGKDASYTVTAPDQANYSKVINGDIITYTFTGKLSKEAEDKETSKEVGVTNDAEKGPDYSIESFDWIDYANKYNDLFKAFGYDKELLYHHYIYNGIREGRIATFTGKYSTVNMDVLEKYTPTSASDPKADTTIDPNGNTMKEEVDAMGTISKLETDKDGNTTVVTTNPDGSKTETVLDAEGNVVSTQTYKTGDSRVTNVIVWSSCGLAIIAMLGFVVFGINSRSIETALAKTKTSKSKK